jgi:hypothetical protein
VKKLFYISLEGKEDYDRFIADYDAGTLNKLYYRGSDEMKINLGGINHDKKI